VENLVNMAAIILNGLSVSDFREIITEAVREEIKTSLPQPEKEAPNEKYLTRKETAGILRVSLPTLNDWTKTGKIKGYRIGNRVRYKRNEVSEALNQVQTLKFRQA
jgi:excisionase family DNA binding protein